LRENALLGSNQETLPSPEEENVGIKEENIRQKKELLMFREERLFPVAVERRRSMSIRI